MRNPADLPLTDRLPRRRVAAVLAAAALAAALPACSLGDAEREGERGARTAEEGAEDAQRELEERE